MALRAKTQWNRVTLQKAMATCISDAEENAPDGAYRKVKLVMRNGIASFAILDAGIDANTVIAGSRSYEWSEVDANVPIPHFELLPDQVLWAMVSNNLANAPGIAHCSVIIEFHDGGR